jgi:tetratricopeptide (TPR) repeat protein
LFSMQNNLDKYTQEVKSSLNKNFLSPLFIRLANLLYVNEQYEDCIETCKTGLTIYPNYLTAKLILLKAFLKAEYLNEAEILFKEIKSKITNKDLLSKLSNNIRSLKTISKQEKIYYSKSPKNKFDYKSFEKVFHLQENLFSHFTLKDVLNDNPEIVLENEKDFRNFITQFESFHFEKSNLQSRKHYELPEKKQLPSDEPDELLNKIKIITETLADIYAEQGNYKDAFDAYNILLRAGSGNSKRIEEKIYELERNMNKG